MRSARAEVEQFVARLAPAPSEADQLVAAGDEDSLRTRSRDGAATIRSPWWGSRACTSTKGQPDRGPEDRRPDPRDPRDAPARGRGEAGRAAGRGPARWRRRHLLDGLLDRVKGDENARQEFLDLLETLGPEDPRTSQYRKALAARLF